MVCHVFFGDPFWRRVLYLTYHHRPGGLAVADALF